MNKPKCSPDLKGCDKCLSSTDQTSLQTSFGRCTVIYTVGVIFTLAKDAGLAATIQLARVLGLRSEEAVQSSHSLKTWQKEISKVKLN